MTDTPMPVLPDAHPPQPPQRRRFVLARLADAVRRQDWFTVLVEIAIVVLGVVIGFQVTAWGQARADRAKEQTYLRQVAQDLRETEALLDDADAFNATSDVTTATLARSFSRATPPSRDSLLTWIANSQGARAVDPVTGTVEALVATGDLGLVRDDSLRSAITAYLGAVRWASAVQELAQQRWLDERRIAYRRISWRDFWTYIYGMTPEEQAATFGDPRFPASGSPERRPFAFDAQAFLSDPDVLVALEEMAIQRFEMAKGRIRLREAGADLLRRVDTEIQP